MAETNSPSARNAAAAEDKTAAVGAENRREKVAATRTVADAEKRQTAVAGESASDAKARRADAREELAQADSAADKLQQAGDVDTDLAGEVALNPYPEDEAKDVAELRGVAEGRNVEINRDVEKAEWVRLLREKDPTNTALDFMTLEQLRGLAGEQGVELGDEFVKAHLVTELRAADTGVNNPAQHVL